MDAELPTITQIVMMCANFARNWGWLALLLGAFGFWQVGQARRDPARRLAMDRWFLTVPLVRTLITNLDTARFCRTLGTLLANGVPLIGALNITRETLTNGVFTEQTKAIAEGVQQGTRLSAAIADSGVFPRQAVHLIQVGEESGRLDSMLERCAEIYDRDTETTIQRGLTLFQPALIVSLALVIAIIIMSLILAILAINDLPF
jgi:Type II secretory pathway, component PulF